MTPQAAAKRIRIIRLAAASCAAVLVAVLCICQVATPPSQVEPRYPTDGSINRELVMVLCALAVTGWGYSVRLRCSSAETMRCLLAVATLLFFWLALTVAKWNVQSSIAGSIMWYLFYLPMLAVPTFVLFSIVPQTKWGSSPRARWARAACFAIDGVLLVLVLTNNLHHAVFDFDLSDPEWSSAYAYAPGYAVVYIWTIAQYLGFLVIAFVNARKDLRKTLVVVGFFLVVGAAYSILYVLGTSFPLNLTTVQSLLVMIGMECALELGILPSYAWYGALFKTVPYDVRVLDGKGRVFAQSDAAKPLPEHLAARAVRVAGHSDGPVTLHLSKTPRSSYTVLRYWADTRSPERTSRRLWSSVPSSNASAPSSSVATGRFPTKASSNARSRASARKRGLQTASPRLWQKRSRASTTCSTRCRTTRPWRAANSPKSSCS